MGLEKETISLMFPKELLSHFEIVLVQELGHTEFKEDFIEVVFEEKNILPPGIDATQYESKGFYSKQIQDFPLRGKAVFLRIKRRVWRHKGTKKTITTDYRFLPECNTAPKDYSADSLAKWTRNVVDDYVAPGDTTNFTDANNLKQGKWLTIVHGKVVKTLYYKDGKLVKGC